MQRRLGNKAADDTFVSYLRLGRTQASASTRRRRSTAASRASSTTRSSGCTGAERMR